MIKPTSIASRVARVSRVSSAAISSPSALTLQTAKKVGENRTSMLIELELKPCDQGRGVLESLRFLDTDIPRVLKTAGIKRSSSEGPPIFHLYDADGLKIGQIEGQEAVDFQATLLEYCPECSLSYDEEVNENLKPNVMEQLVDLKFLKKVLI